MTHHSSPFQRRTALLVVLLCVSAIRIGAATKPSKVDDTGGSRWSVQVAEVDPGNVAIEPAFRIAIYENLLHEAAKVKRFQQTFRNGDRNADSIANLLVLKIKVEKYTPGSE